MKFSLEVDKQGETTLQVHWFASSMVDGFQAAARLGIAIPLRCPGWRMRRTHFHNERGKGSRASCIAFIDRLHVDQGDLGELKALLLETVNPS